MSVEVALAASVPNGSRQPPAASRQPPAASRQPMVDVHADITKLTFGGAVSTIAGAQNAGRER